MKRRSTALLLCLLSLSLSACNKETTEPKNTATFPAEQQSDEASAESENPADGQDTTETSLIDELGLASDEQLLWLLSENLNQLNRTEFSGFNIIEP